MLIEVTAIKKRADGRQDKTSAMIQGTKCVAATINSSRTSYLAQAVEDINNWAISNPTPDVVNKNNALRVSSSADVRAETAVNVIPRLFRQPE